MTASFDRSSQRMHTGAGRGLRSYIRRIFWFLPLLVALVGYLAPGNGQQGPAQGVQRPIVIFNRSMDTHEINALQEKSFNKRNFDAANAARKLQIDDETDKLLILARDLKAKSDNLGNAPLTPTMVREAEVIQFLANDVKEKMRLTVNSD